ncbi:MAG: helix-hairpin-helix domain-containing protein [Planctomycetota bacterium]|nr:helix-hairpin-helix domain-containing protein [Planctomycetota bacterium]
MIGRLTGTLESLDELSALISVPGGICYEVSVPAFLVPRLEASRGKPVTFITFHYFEGQGQGAWFIPRLIGFLSPQERDFFEVFTTVKGIGNRKALRAMAVEPSAIAAAIAQKNPSALSKLPEIGKRLAETIIAELTGKVDGFLSSQEVATMDVKASGAAATPGSDEAILALIALGETRSDAEKLVARAMDRARRETIAIKNTEDLLAVVFASRA